MIKLIEFECTTFKTMTKGVLHTGNIPFVVCPRCGATHILVDQRLTNVQFINNPIPTPNTNEGEKKEEEKKGEEEKNESSNN